MVQVTSDVMKEFKQAIKDMKEFSVISGDPNSDEASKVNIEWSSSDVMDRPRYLFVLSNEKVDYVIIRNNIILINKIDLDLAILLQTIFLKKKNLYIVSIKKFNSTPYNGCRPRKLKRKKRRKLSFNT